MNTNAMAIEPSSKFHWSGSALGSLSAASFTLYLYAVNSYEKGTHLASAVVVAKDKSDAVSMAYANQDLAEVLVDIEVKLLGIAVSGVDRQVVLNTAV